MSLLARKRNTPSAASLMNEEELPDTLNDVLDSPQLRKEFREFLKARLANESLLFFESIELYEQIEKEPLRTKAGKQMIAEFVVEHSECWVNIPASLREDLTSVTVFEPETFSSAKKEVMLLMSSNFLDSFKKYLQGIETDSAPKLSFDSSTTPAYLRSLSFEQLADSLGENILRDDESEHAKGSQTTSGTSKCNCKRSASELKEGEFCCDKMRIYARIKALKNRRFDQIRQSLTPSGLLRKYKKEDTGDDTEGSTKSRVKRNIFSIFSKRPSSTKGMKMWAEIEKEQELKYQI